MSQRKGLIAVVASFTLLVLGLLHFALFTTYEYYSADAFPHTTGSRSPMLIDRLWSNSPFKPLVSHGRSRDDYTALSSEERTKLVRYLYMFEGSMAQNGYKLRPTYAEMQKVLEDKTREVMSRPENQPGAGTLHNSENDLEQQETLLNRNSLHQKQPRRIPPPRDLDPPAHSSETREHELNFRRMRRSRFPGGRPYQLARIYEKKTRNEQEADDWLRQILGTHASI